MTDEGKIKVDVKGAIRAALADDPPANAILSVAIDVHSEDVQWVLDALTAARTKEQARYEHLILKGHDSRISVGARMQWLADAGESRRRADTLSDAIGRLWNARQLDGAERTFTRDETLNELACTMEWLRAAVRELNITPRDCPGGCGRRYYSDDDVHMLRSEQEREARENDYILLRKKS